MLKHRWIAFALFAAVLAFAGTAEARNYPMLFGSKEIGSANWTFKKGVVPEWRAMLGRWKNGAACESNICTAKSWNELVAQVKAAGDPMAKIRAANDLMNKQRYIEDMPNWNKTEFWATSYEFLKKNGDCEDFSIAKYMLLKAAGIPVENMRIVAVRIKSLGGIGHAVLVVYQGNTALVLDNRVKPVMDEKLVRSEFQPALSVNEKSWWVHLPGK